MTNISICQQIPGWKGRPTNGHRVALRYRKDGCREVEFFDQYPRFYINPATFRLLRNGRGIDFSSTKEVIDYFLDNDEIHSFVQDSQNEDKVPLYRVECYTSAKVRYFQNNYGPVYGADLPQEDALVIDKELDLEDFDSEYHVGYFDIEALQFRNDDPEKHKWLENVRLPIWQDNQMVNSIVVYSNFTKEYTAFACHPNWERENIKHEWGNEHRFTTEYDMLTLFADWMFAMDFDVLTGWNSAGYDFPVLYHRMESLGVPHPMNDMAGRCENGLFPKPLYGGSCLSPYGIVDPPTFKSGRNTSGNISPFAALIRSI